MKAFPFFSGKAFTIITLKFNGLRQEKFPQCVERIETPRTEKNISPLLKALALNRYVRCVRLIAVDSSYRMKESGYDPSKSKITEQF